MQITWVAYNIIEQVGERYVSNVASARYRLILPAQALSGMGHRIRLLQVGPDSRLDEVASKMDGELVVFLKIASPDASVFDRMAKLTLGMLRAAREQGKRVVADISDDHFGHPHEGGYFRELVNEVDLVVASTPGMAGIVRRHTQRPVHTVSDPYEGARRGAKFEPPPRKAGGLLGQALRAVTSGGRPLPLRLLWFGHGSNFATVFNLVSQLHRLLDRWRVEVHFVTGAGTNAAAFCEEFNRDYAPACSLRFSPWSLETTWHALEECDMVVIPSRLNDPAKAVKSPNRLIESLWAGRFVCANPVPSYQEFDPFAWLGDDIVSGIEWALEHPPEVRRRIGAAQQYIAQHYSPEAIAKQWETAFVAARNTAAARVSGGATTGTTITSSRANPSPRYLELMKLYRTMHQEGEKFLGVPPEKTFPGKSLIPQVHRIKALIQKTGATTILDYGSGKGKQYDPQVVKQGAGGEWPSVIDYWDVDEVICYDPCYPPFSRYPTGKSDGVISTDVLEHCPEEDMPWIVEEIFGFATRFVFANVACYPARKRLPTGENAHCTIRPVEWWRDLVQGVAARHPGIVWEVWVQSRVETPEGPKHIDERIGGGC